MILYPIFFAIFVSFIEVELGAILKPNFPEVVSVA